MTTSHNNFLGSAAATAGAALLSAFRFVRQTLFYTTLIAVAIIAWLGIVQPRWLVYDGPEDCSPPAAAVSRSMPMPGQDAAEAFQSKLYSQCLAHNAALTDTQPLTRAGFERLVARENVHGWWSVRFFMVVVLLAGVLAASLESALMHLADPGYEVRTDRRTSGPRIIDYGYPDVFRCRRP